MQSYCQQIQSNAPDVIYIYIIRYECICSQTCAKHDISYDHHMSMFLDMGIVHISLTAILKVSFLAVILQANHPERERG